MPLSPVQIVAVIGTAGTLLGLVTTWYYHRQTTHLLEVQRRITWSDLPRESQKLRNEIQGELDVDIIVTPGTRGATIANLMYGVTENIMLYVGIREDARGKNALRSPPKDFDELPKTKKYQHYLPSGVRMENTDKSVLILDDFTDSGDTLAVFRSYLEDVGFPPDRIKTATIVCSSVAENAGKAPDFYALKMTHPFYFPWGKAI